MSNNLSLKFCEIESEGRFASGGLVIFSVKSLMLIFSKSSRKGRM